MKFVIQSLQFGDVIEAVVTEILSEDEVIMSFKGDLLRVQNQSLKPLELGQKINCRVSAVDPLRFEIFHSYVAAFKMDLVV
jgi:hypothetical protein